MAAFRKARNKITGVKKQAEEEDPTGDSDVTETTLPFANVDFRDATNRTPLMDAALHGKVENVRSIFEMGADPSLVDNERRNSLHFAAYGGNIDIIDLILTKVPNIESRTKKGHTPLMLAAYNGKLHAVRWLLEKGASATNECNRRWNSLHMAAEYGDTEIIDLLHSYLPNIELKTSDDYTPLMVAAGNGKLQAVEWFIEKGADVTREVERKWNILHLAAKTGNTDILDRIPTHSLSIDSKTSEGYTPLMVAAGNGKLEAVKWFLEKGANVTCKSSRGWNTLHFAAQSGNTNVIALIHTHLLSIESKTSEGYTPLIIAVSNGKLHAVEWFLEKGATTTCEDQRGRNMLHFAAEGGDTDLLDLFHERVPNIDSRSVIDDLTPLMVAAAHGKLQAVQWFLQKGATVSCVDNNGFNPLHFAAKSGDPDTIDLVLTCLRDIDFKTALGETPLIVAVRHGNLQGVKHLLKRGADPSAKDKEGKSSFYHATFRGSEFLVLLASHVANSESTTGNN